MGHVPEVLNEVSQTARHYVEPIKLRIMEWRKTKNGKTCFDIRRQHRKVSNDLLIRYHKELKRLVTDGTIKTKNQYLAKRAEQDKKLNALYDYTVDYIKTVYAGYFPLWG